MCYSVHKAHLEEPFSRLSALKIKPSESEVEGRKFGRWFRFALQFRADLVATGRRSTSSPKPRQRSYKQPIVQKQMETHGHSLGQRIETMTLLFQNSHCCHFTEAKAASLGGSDYADEVEPLDGTQGIVRTWVKINKSVGACGGLWLLTCETNQLFSPCGDTRETLHSSDRSGGKLAHCSSEKTKPFILSRTTYLTSSLSTSPENGGSVAGL